jgi:hypothetical protein
MMVRQLIGAGVLSLVATGASAQPANDDILSATTLTLDGGSFTDALDTSAATPGADDLFGCSSGPTVWYSFTPETDMRVDFDTAGSSYDTVLTVFTGEPGNLAFVGCIDDFGGSLQARLIVNTTAGVKYYIMVSAFADQPGGPMMFSASEAPAFTVRRPRLPRVGIIDAAVPNFTTFSGSVTCSTPAEVFLFLELLQERRSDNSGPGSGDRSDGRTNGRERYRVSFGSTGVSCQSSAEWSITLTDTIFRPGTSIAAIIVQAFDSFTGEFVEFRIADDVRLRRAR